MIKLNIGKRMGLGFAVILILLAILSGSSIFSLQSVKGKVAAIEQAQQRLLLQTQIQSKFNAATGYFRGFVAYGDEQMLQNFEKAMNEIIQLENQLLQIARKEKVGVGVVQNLIQLSTQYRDIALNELIPLVRAHHQELANGNLTKAQAYKEQIVELASRVKHVPLAQKSQKVLEPRLRIIFMQTMDLWLQT